MGDWRDDVKETLKTAEDREEEKKQKEAAAEAKVKRAVLEAVRRAGNELNDAATIIGKKAKVPVAVRTRGNAFTLDGSPDASLSVEEGPDGLSILIGFDGKQKKYIYNRVQDGFADETNQHNIVDINEVVGQLIRRFAEKVKR